MLHWRLLLVAALPAFCAGADNARTPSPTPTPARAASSVTRFAGGLETAPSTGKDIAATELPSTGSVTNFHPEPVRDLEAFSAPVTTAAVSAKDAGLRQNTPSSYAPVAAVTLAPTENRQSADLAPLPAAQGGNSSGTAPLSAVSSGASALITNLARADVMALSVVPQVQFAAAQQNGVVYSPGGKGAIGTLNVPGKLELNGGDAYLFDFRASNDGKKLLTDKITTSVLDIDSTRYAPFLITLNSYNAKGQKAALDGTLFDPTRSYAWTLIAADKMYGFSTTHFVIDSTGFLNNTQGGKFSLTRNGDDLVLNFTPVPEPSTWLLLITGSLTLFGFTLRRRR